MVLALDQDLEGCAMGLHHDARFRAWFQIVKPSQGWQQLAYKALQRRAPYF